MGPRSLVYYFPPWILYLSGDIQRDLDTVYKWSVKLDGQLPAAGVEANRISHIGPPGHQVSMDQTQQARNIETAVNAGFKNSLQCQKMEKNAWLALCQIMRTARSRRPNVRRPLDRLEYWVQAWKKCFTRDKKTQNLFHVILKADQGIWCTGDVSRGWEQSTCNLWKYVGNEAT